MADNINSLNAEVGMDTTNFKIGTKELDRQMRLAESAFKSAASTMEDWGASEQGLEEKIKSLSAKIDIQKQKVAKLASEYQRISKEQGENSAGAKEMLISLNYQTAALGRNQTELEKHKSTLGKMRDTTESTSDKLLSLDKDLKVVESELNITSTSTNDLKQNMNLLTQATEIHKQKLDLLEKEYADVTTQQGKNSNAAKDLKIQINNETAALNKNQAMLKGSTSGATDLNGILGQLSSTTGLNVSPALSDLTSIIGGGAGLLAGLGGIVGAAFAATNALVDMSIETASISDDLMTLSSQTGLSVETIQELTYASGLLDTPVDTITSSMARLTRTMSSAKDRTSEQAEAFRRLHVGVTDASGHLKDNETVFYETIDSLKKVSNETERDALSMTIFGKSAQDLNPLIQAGSGKLAELSEEAHDVGYVMSDETVQSFGKLDDATVRTNLSVDAFKHRLSKVLLPAVTDVNGGLKAMLDNMFKLGGNAPIVDIINSIKSANGETAAASKAYANGTNYHTGGVALVGEEGPELVNLPVGSQVYTASETRNLLNSQNKASANLINFNSSPSNPDGTVPPQSSTTRTVTVKNYITLKADDLEDAAHLARILNDFEQVKNAGEAY